MVECGCVPDDETIEGCLLHQGSIDVVDFSVLNRLPVVIIVTSQKHYLIVKLTGPL